MMHSPNQPKKASEVCSNRDWYSSASSNASPQMHSMIACQSRAPRSASRGDDGEGLRRSRQIISRSASTIRPAGASKLDQWLESDCEAHQDDSNCNTANTSGRSRQSDRSTASV